ncbi:MAG: hypothetical protein ACK56I_27170, partial [bacterium]
VQAVAYTKVVTPAAGLSRKRNTNRLVGNCWAYWMRSKCSIGRRGRRCRGQLSWGPRRCPAGR